METLKITTAGNVNDGKSTLIGRLLYELGAIKEDKLKAISLLSEKTGFKGIDYSLFADGLMEERENSITIDVAYLYFSTQLKNYILADSPGHFEFTRNMITGASNAQVFIILIDIQKGVADQTCLHAYIASMLRIPKLVVCVNKLDTVEFAASAFEGIRNHFFDYIQKLDFMPQVDFIPISALYGDNIVSLSKKTPWYKGSTLLQTLESYRVVPEQLPMRFRIQNVFDFVNSKGKNQRYYLGKIISGCMQKNMKVTALPLGESNTIEQINKGKKTLQKAMAPESVSLTLATPLEISRGSILVQSDYVPRPSRQISAEICWFDELPGVDGGVYLLKHGMNTVSSRIVMHSGRKNVMTLLYSENTGKIHTNDLCQVRIHTELALPFERYKDNKTNGCFVLIDTHSNKTIAVGIIQEITP